MDYLRNERKEFEIEDKTTKGLFELELKHWKLDPESEVIRKLQQIMESEPNHTTERTLGIWKQIGPLNLEKLVRENKLEFQKEHFIHDVKEIKEYTSADLTKADYIGQINSEDDKREGFGRMSWYDGEIHEAYYQNGKYNGFGRFI